MRKSLQPRLWLAVLFAASSPSVQALQVLDARDGVSVAAKLSLKEPTRIKVEGAAIGEVFGNVWQDKTNPAGEVIVETDPGKGELYVRPVSASATKPINLFVSTAHATYTLLLQPVDMPADTIVLRDRTSRVARSASSPGKAPTHVRALTTFLTAMASDAPSSDMRVEDTALDVRLWQATRFTLLRRYESPGLIGERYLLTNLGAAALALESRCSTRKACWVAVEQTMLEPQAATFCIAGRDAMMTRTRPASPSRYRTEGRQCRCRGVAGRRLCAALRPVRTDRQPQDQCPSGGCETGGHHACPGTGRAGRREGSLDRRGRQQGRRARSEAHPARTAQCRGAGALRDAAKADRDRAVYATAATGTSVVTPHSAPQPGAPRYVDQSSRPTLARRRPAAAAAATVSTTRRW